jgi:nucleoside-diphosphate-sugar epimerase
MRVFVSGATGVIGRRVVPQLIAEGHDVTGIARAPDKRAAMEAQGATARQVSLFDTGALADAVAGHDVVVNLATHIPTSPVRMLLRSGWRENDHIRRQGSANLVDAALAAGAGRFVQESFAPLYQDHGDAWIDEEAAFEPTRYNSTVLDAERSARRFADAGGAGVVLRFAAFYGPDAAQLDGMIRLVRHGQAPLPGRADSFVSSVSHDDAATAVVAALRLPSGIYNVADDQPLRHREYVDALADAIGAPHPWIAPAWVAMLGGATLRMMARSERISNRKLRAATPWAPCYPSVREGFPVAVRAA